MTTAIDRRIARLRRFARINALLHFSSRMRKAHLVLIIHGVGPHDIGKRTRYLNIINNNMAKLLKRKFSKVDEKVEFVFTEWHSALDQYRDIVAQDLTVPKGFQLLKKVMSDVLSDALFYSEQMHRERIVRAVVDQINTAVLEFNQRFSEYEVKVSHIIGQLVVSGTFHPLILELQQVHLLGHSLGSVIAYDILCAAEHPSPSSRNRLRPDRRSSTDENLAEVKDVATSSRTSAGGGGTLPLCCSTPPLCCSIANLFICGSPLALFLTIRDSFKSARARAAAQMPLRYLIFADLFSRLLQVCISISGLHVFKYFVFATP